MSKLFEYKSEESTLNRDIIDARLESGYYFTLGALCAITDFFGLKISIVKKGLERGQRVTAKAFGVDYDEQT